MVRVRVEYDGYNRSFKLVDRQFGSSLDDGAIYELAIPFELEELEDEPATILRGLANA
jgi:hypothetical protein